MQIVTLASVASEELGPVTVIQTRKSTTLLKPERARHLAAPTYLSVASFSIRRTSARVSSFPLVIFDARLADVTADCSDIPRFIKTSWKVHKEAPSVRPTPGVSASGYRFKVSGSRVTVR